MNKRFWRLALVAGMAFILTGCGNKETRQALQKASALEDQKQYYDANAVLMDALQARESKIRRDAGLPEAGTAADSAASDALRKKELSDPEYIKLERAQVLL